MAWRKREAPVITCNRCGTPNPSEMSNCRYCGAALVVQNSAKPKTNTQEQIPSWLESLKAIERPTPPPGGQPDFSVADIVDPNALPGWMRSDSASRGADSGKHPAMRPASMSGPNTDSSSISPGSLSANSLIDSSSLPPWLQPQQAGQTGQPGIISASSLIESEKLPGWLSEPPAVQNSGGQVGNAARPGPSEPPGKPMGISASSLLDVNALPPWLREESKPEQQPSGGVSTGIGSPGLSAGSLIDPNMLPDWLRNAEQAQPGNTTTPASSNAFGSSAAYGGQAVPPRVENVRVPSRPRAEMAPLEQSEMAASVFSSMLGVASVSPSYPTSGGDYLAQQSFQPTPQMPPFSAPLQGPGANQPIPGQQGGISSPPPYPGMPPASPPQNTMPGAPGGAYQPMMQQAGVSGPGGQNAYPGSTVNSPVPASPQGGHQPDQQAGGTAGTKTAKRSFLETIRGWFHF